MSFTLLSVALLLIVAVCVAFGIINGIKQGLIRSAISFAVTLCSLIVAGTLAVLIFKLEVISDLAYEFIYSLGITNELIGIDELIYAYSRALVAPFLFVLLFALASLLFGTVKNIFFKTKLKKLPDDTEAVSEDDPWYKKHSVLFGAIISGFCGFIKAAVHLIF